MNLFLPFLSSSLSFPPHLWLCLRFDLLSFFFPPFTSSSDESHASSALSVPSSAGALAGLMEPLDSSVVGHTLETLKGYYCNFSII